MLPIPTHNRCESNSGFASGAQKRANEIYDDCAKLAWICKTFLASGSIARNAPLCSSLQLAEILLARVRTPLIPECFSLSAYMLLVVLERKMVSEGAN